MFGQSFETHDLILIAVLVVLEGILSIDNALVLGVLAKRLPTHQQKKALTYGLVGAFIFRFIAIGLATYLMKFTLVKLIGGAYLVFIAIKHFMSRQTSEEHAAETLEQLENTVGGSPATATFDHRFWYTVGVIEITDIAFAIDSILAAIGVVGSPPPLATGGPNPKAWVVVAGGCIGVVMMRFAAILFIKLLEKFPRFESAAYLLVLVIGLKLLIDWGGHEFGFDKTINFHDFRAPAFWIFWIVMAGCFCVGFLPERRDSRRDMSAAVKV